MYISKKIKNALSCPLKQMNRLALAIVVTSLVCLSNSEAFIKSAYSITEETEAAISDAQQRIEESGQRYNEVMLKIDETNLLISDTQDKISGIEAELPLQREKSSTAIKTLYVFQSSSSGLLDIILHAESFTDFLDSVHYLNIINESTHAEIDRLDTMTQELADAQKQLSDEREALQIESQSAKNSLNQAQADREAAQEDARIQAEAEAAEAARIAKEAQEEQEAQQEAEQEEDQGEEVTPAQPSYDIDWSVDKAAFVSDWSARIDAYLAGSPTAGCGKYYAEAAWDFGVDPRWSPAISNTESSKGAALFRPFNAWGWGSYSYGSWEEAIFAHVGGLSRGYGYTISLEGAKRYCPPTYEHWYNVTLAQMNMI